LPNAGQVVQSAHQQVRTVERAIGRPTWRRVLPALALAGLVLALQACREDEQGRPLLPDKGSYQGPVDQKLDQDQIDALRKRAAEQRI
jgi:hypothetical protein